MTVDLNAAARIFARLQQTAKSQSKYESERKSKLAHEASGQCDGLEFALDCMFAPLVEPVTGAEHYAANKRLQAAVSEVYRIAREQYGANVIRRYALSALKVPLKTQEQGK